MSQFTQRTAQHELFAFVANQKIRGTYNPARIAAYAADLGRQLDRAHRTEVINLAGLVGTRAQLCAYFGVEIA